MKIFYAFFQGLFVVREMFSAKERLLALRNIH
jgi:hypothetical protein